jgi:hypothetical protein
MSKQRQQFIENMVIERFKRGDIAEYLSIPPVNTFDGRWQDYRDNWEKVAKHLFSREEKNCMEGVAIPFLAKGYEGSGNEIPFLHFLETKGVEVFSLGNTFLLRYPLEEGLCGYFYGGNGYPAAKLQPSHFVAYITVRHSDKVLRALRGWEFIQGRLQQAVESTRQRASAEFDAACAVSEDGTRIVKADKVWIVKPDLSYTEYDAAAFAPRKLPVAEDHGRTLVTYDVSKDAGHLCLGYFYKGRPVTNFITPSEDHEDEFPTIFAIAEALVPPELLK